MPVSYQIFADKKLIIVTYSGALTLEEIMNARKESAADPAFEPVYNVIDDVRAVLSSSINFNEIASISGKSVLNAGVKRALVVSTDLQKGMAHMYKVLSESSGHTFHIFEDYDQALAWVLDNGRDV
ncbi:MAG: STAS/SEC14 domain-containing protein [Gammaproteobacteria bacterium]|nr:STAS/SEC14 domain-containing protein [Gammaproteobacteria bacterium]